MTKTIPTSTLCALPATAQAITLNLRPLPSSQAITLSLRPINANPCSCRGDGKLAFALPWVTITALGWFATKFNPDSSFLFQAGLPGLMAGAAGLILYKATKKVVKHLRHRHRQMAQ
jgi:hypothetical protein